MGISPIPAREPEPRARVWASLESVEAIGQKGDVTQSHPVVR